MPTGYTADIEKGITFEQYAWRCARSFGALVSMRDAPSDADIPAEIAYSDYNSEAASKARLEVIKYTQMSATEARELCEKEYSEGMQRYRAEVIRRARLRDRYNDMKVWVFNFKPPTKEHQALKDFMYQQIELSIDGDCSTQHLCEPEKMDPAVWRMNQIQQARRDMAYHLAEYAKDLDRTNRANEWLAQLRTALKNTKGST